LIKFLISFFILQQVHTKALVL